MKKNYKRIVQILIIPAVISVSVIAMASSNNKFATLFNDNVKKDY